MDEKIDEFLEIFWGRSQRTLWPEIKVRANIICCEQKFCHGSKYYLFPNYIELQFARLFSGYAQSPKAGYDPENACDTAWTAASTLYYVPFPGCRYIFEVSYDS